jgi:succinoglycan biosynthesis transport protein ExoP
LSLWDLDSGEQQQLDTGRFLGDFGFSPDDRYVTYPSDTGIRFWSLERDQLAAELSVGEYGADYGMFVPHSWQVVVGDGYKVLLIDADLRQPAASRLAAPEATLGIMDMAAGKSWREIVQMDAETGLAILPAVSAETVSTSNDFLTSQPVQSMLEEARREFDYVVIDLPPLGPMVDALSIEPWTDGFILVTEWGRTPRRLVRAILENEPQLSDEIIGVVLNKVDFARLGRYSDPGAAEKYVGAYGRYYNVASPQPARQTIDR